MLWKYIYRTVSEKEEFGKWKGLVSKHDAISCPAKKHCRAKHSKAISCATYSERIRLAAGPQPQCTISQIYRLIKAIPGDVGPRYLKFSSSAPAPSPDVRHFRTCHIGAADRPTTTAISQPENLHKYGTRSRWPR